MKSSRKLTASCFFALAMADPSVAAEQGSSAKSPVPREAYIAFANQGGIRDWQVADESTLLVQDSHGRWYRARLQAPAFHLPYPESLGFATEPSGTLEKFSSVVVWGKRYPIVSLTRTDPPSRK